MKSVPVPGIVLAVVGALILVYQGINYTRQKTVLDVGPIHATVDEREHIPLSPIIGGLALASGVILIAVGAKQRG